MALPMFWNSVRTETHVKYAPIAKPAFTERSNEDNTIKLRSKGTVEQQQEGEGGVGGAANWVLGGAAAQLLAVACLSLRAEYFDPGQERRSSLSFCVAHVAGSSAMPALAIMRALGAELPLDIAVLTPALGDHVQAAVDRFDDQPHDDSNEKIASEEVEQRRSVIVRSQQRWDSASCEEMVRSQGLSDLILFSAEDDDTDWSQFSPRELSEVLSALLRDPSIEGHDFLHGTERDISPARRRRCGALLVIGGRGDRMGALLRSLAPHLWRKERLCGCGDCLALWLDAFGGECGRVEIPPVSDWLGELCCRAGPSDSARITGNAPVALGVWIERVPWKDPLEHSPFLPPSREISPDTPGYRWLREYGYAEPHLRRLRASGTGMRDNLLGKFWRDRLCVTSGSIDSQDRQWDQFYQSNRDGAYSDRHWLLREFPVLAEVKIMLEAGCGAGNTVWPLLRELPDAFIFAFDFAPAAVELVRSHELYTGGDVGGVGGVSETEDLRRKRQRCVAFVHDLAASPIPSDAIPNATCDAATLIFVLGALPLASQQAAAVENIWGVIKPGGCVCVRDHAATDSSEQRFEGGKEAFKAAKGDKSAAVTRSSGKRVPNKIGEHCFVRGKDRTIAYFFTVDAMCSLFPEDKWQRKSCEVVRRETENRAEKLTLQRLFVQGVFVRR